MDSKTLERLLRELHEAEQKAMAVYLDKELEIERLQANQKRLVEAINIALEYFRIEGQYAPEERGMVRVSIEGKLLAALQKVESNGGLTEH